MLFANKMNMWVVLYAVNKIDADSASFNSHCFMALEADIAYASHLCVRCLVYLKTYIDQQARFPVHIKHVRQASRYLVPTPLNRRHDTTRGTVPKQDQKEKGSNCVWLRVHQTCPAFILITLTMHVFQFHILAALLQFLTLFFIH